MTWELAALLVLGAAIVVGFTWYERTQPTSRMLALVATLAALAALGRIAFAPIPNVKPTTDIVLRLVISRSYSSRTACAFPT